MGAGKRVGACFVALMMAAGLPLVGTPTRAGAAPRVAPTCTPAAPTAVGAASDRVVTTVPQCAGAPAGVTGYRVLASAGSSATPVAQADVPVAVAEAEVTGLTAGTVYRFRVAARNGDGVGPSSAPSALVPVPFLSSDAFTTQQYLDFAGRSATAAEKADWSTKLADGTLTPAAAIDGLQAATYWQAQTPVIRLFQAYFLRLPDLGGLRYWSGRYRTGTTLDTVSASFATSPEFKARYGQLTDRQFVELVYQNVLGRPGEQAGVDYWTGQLETHKKTRGQVMLGVSGSLEYKTKTAGLVDAVNLFTAMLLRVPTKTEVTTWATQPKAAIIAFLLGSSGYESRVQVVAPPAVTTTSLPDGSTGADYPATTLTALAGEPPLTWDVAAGSVPDGLFLDFDGSITGTPATAGSSTFTVRVTDAQDRTATKQLKITVKDFAITTASLPPGNLSVPYSQQLASAYGTPPVTWATSDPLPPGLALSTAGLLSGTPTTLGGTTFTVTATDGLLRTATRDYTLTVVNPPNPIVTTAAAPGGQVGVGYAGSLAAVGGASPYTWSISAGALPAGLSLSPSTGLISGTPSAAGTASFTAKVTDAGAKVATKALSIVVTAASDWPQAAHDEGRTGWAPNEAVITPANAGSVTEEWSDGRGAGGVAVVGGVAYLTGHQPGDTDARALMAVTIEGGDPLWSVPLDPTCTQGPVLVTATRLVISCGNGLQAYSRTGAHARLWDTNVSDVGTNPYDALLIGSTVVAWGGQSVTAYRESDGERLWQVLTPSGLTLNAVAAAGTRVVVAYSDRLRAFNLSNGSLSWGKVGVVSSSVVVSGGWIYTNDGGGVRRFALDTGTPDWNVRAGTGISGVFAADGTKVYAWEATFGDFGLQSSILRALNVSNGAQAWEAQMSEFVSAVAVAGDVVWATNTGRGSGSNTSSVIALRRTDGAELAHPGFDARSYVPMAVANGHVVVAAGDAVHVLGFAPPRPTITSRIVASGRVAQPYSHDLTATGGTPAYAWSVVSGALPAGLSLSPAGSISGTPTAAGIPRVRVRVTDSKGRTATQDLAVQVNPAGTGSWNTSGMSGARNGFNPFESVVSLDAAPTLAARWTTAVAPNPDGHDGDDSKEPVVVGTRLYHVQTNGLLYAYDTTGSTTNRLHVWKAAADAGHWFATAPTESGGTLYLLDEALTLYAVRASDGVRLWKHALPDAVAPPTSYGRAPLVAGGAVMFLDGSLKLYALAASTGSPLWGGATPKLSELSNFPSAPLATDGTRAYVLIACKLHSITISTGVEAWSAYVEPGTNEDCNPFFATLGAPTVADGAVFVGSFGGTAAFEAATGALRWRSASGSGLGYSVSNGVLLVPRIANVGATSWTYLLTALDVKTGVRLWENLDDALSSAPSVAGDLVLARGSGQVAGYDITSGQKVWSANVVGLDYAFGRLSVGGGRIYLSTYAAGVKTFAPPAP
ncbi:MAG: Ig family protein [Acidimicrobiales bacterium]|nr:Ig family protein [Acidimicrobiales bacterium]